MQPKSNVHGFVDLAHSMFCALLCCFRNLLSVSSNTFCSPPFAVLFVATSRWYNPAVESQATDRAFRIGQDKKVFVHKLICSSTFEEKIDKMIDEKQELASLSVKAGEKWITDMNNSELQDLFMLSENNGDSA